MIWALALMTQLRFFALKVHVARFVAVETFLHWFFLAFVVAP